MALTKDKKGEILEKLKKIVKDSVSIVFVNFHSLPVAESSAMRKALREKGIGYMVAKKTLTKKALTEGGAKGDLPELPGELGIVYLPALALAKQAGGTDAIDPARELYTFQKKLDKKIQIVGGIFEGKFMTKEEMTVVAQIPGLKTLHAQFVNLINSPIQGLVIALNAITEVKSS